MNFLEFWQNFDRILMSKDSNDSVARQPNLSTLVRAHWESIDPVRMASQDVPQSSGRRLPNPRRVVVANGQHKSAIRADPHPAHL